MEGRKLSVVAILLGLFLAVASIITYHTVSANKINSAAPSGKAKQATAQAVMTLHVSGSNPELKYKDAADLRESALSEGDNARPVALLKADINNDGLPDLIAAYSAADHSELRVRFNTSFDVLSDPISVPVNQLNISAIASGDFNVDGLKDIAIADRSGNISILYGDGKGGFTPGPTIHTGGSIAGMVQADIDHDGLDDLVVIDEASATLKIYIGQGDLGQATPLQADLSSLGHLQAVTVGDFNIDHWKDVAVAGDQGVAVLWGTGNGSLSKPHKIGAVGPVAGMVVADFNGDYLPDLAVAGSTGVTVFTSHKGNKFGAGKSYPAGNGLTAIVSGAFDSDAFTDLAVADSEGNVSVLLNKKGRSFSQPLSMSVDGGATALLAGFKKSGVDSIAMARKSGGITIAAASGGTVTVTTAADENDCPSCDVAGLESFTNGTGFPGGGDGLSLREAITAINNDSVLHGSSNWTISFAGITRTANTLHGPEVPFTCQHLSQGSSWLLFVDAHPNGSPNGLGDLPPIDAPGTTIDGNLVNTTADGVNNPDGPKVIIRGNNVSRLLVLTSNAPNTIIQNLNLVNSNGDAIVVQGVGNTITNNVIGLDCDSSSTQGPLNDGNQGAGINFQSGTINETVTNNIIGNNLNGIVISGVTGSTAIPQNNEISGNIIGLGKDLRHLDLPPLDPGVCSGCGTYVPAPRGNKNDGILLNNGADGNTIENNTISNNGASNPAITGSQSNGNGIEIQGDISSDAIIRNNKIGTDPSGITTKDAANAAIGNLGDGIFIGSLGNPKFNQVTQNIISGNGGPLPPPAPVAPGGVTPQVDPAPASPLGGGIEIGAGDFNAQFNTVTANKIGTNVNGSVQLPNTRFGIALDINANNNTIGGATAADGNVISGNGVNTTGPGMILQDHADNNLIQNNLIGANSLGTGAPTDLVNPSNPISNKGGGIEISGAAFANRIIGNQIAFNNSNSTVSGITCDATTTGSFNTFSQNAIFLNPPNNTPTAPAINELGSAGGAQQGLANTEIISPPPPPQTTLIKIDSGTTITATGDTTITGTANFKDNAVVGANINNSKVEIFVSQRGSASEQIQSEAQAFLGTVTSFQVDPKVASGNVVDWSAHFTIPAPFLNPVQTPVLFLTATITTGDGSTSPLSLGFVPQFVSSGGGGGGTGCSLSAAPSVVTFNGAPIGQTTTQNVVLTNNGSTTVNVSGLTLNQTGTKFGLGSVTTPVNLAVNGQLTIPVTFTPTDATGATATLTISNTCSGSLVIPISGNGGSSKISVIPTSLAFGSVGTGQTKVLPLTIINFGSIGLNITGLTITNSATSGFSLPTNPAPFTINAQSTATVNVQFGPTKIGPATDTLVIASNDPANPTLNIALTGTGTDTTPPTVVVNQPSGGAHIGGGSTFTVGFAAQDNVGLQSYTIKLSTDGGVSFPFTLGTGIPSSTGLNSVTVTAPNVATTLAVVQVTATDTSGNVGTGLSNVFTIGAAPVILSATLTKQLNLSGTGIVAGAVVIVTNTDTGGSDTFTLTSTGGSNWNVPKPQAGLGGQKLKQLVAKGQHASLVVVNPSGAGGLSSAPFSTTRVAATDDDDEPVKK